MKKFIKFIVLIFVCSVFITSGTAYANSAPPTPTPDNSGLIFNKFEDVSITKEVLDLKLINSSVDVKATYWMKNNTSDSLSFETAFISDSYIRNDSQNVSIKKNGEVIPHTMKHFIRDYENSTSWEEELANQPVFEKKLGEGGGFKLYKVDIEDKNNDKKIIIKRPATILGENNFFIKRAKYFEYIPPFDFSFISDSKEIEFNGLKYEVLEIENIYNYFENHNTLEGIEKQLKDLLIAKYLQNVKIDDNYSVDRNFSISSVFLYNVDILPNEEITLSVEYLSGTGGRKKSYINFRYLLSPAKYWSDFKDLTINLTLNKEYPRLTNSSLDFKKEGKYQYSFHSNELPPKDLFFSANCSRWQGFINSLPYMIMFLPTILIVLAFLILIIVIIVIVRKIMKKKKNKDKKTK